MPNFATGTTIANVFLPNLSPQDPEKQAMVFASRKLNGNNQLILPQGSTPMPSLYIPFRLAAYTDPISALVELRKMGFQYTLGLTFNATFSAPDNVTSDPVSGLTILTWNSPTVGIQNLVGENPSGSVTQNNSSIISTGTIKSVSVVGNQSFMVLSLVNSSPNFTSSNSIVINAQLTSQSPDPTLSDEICVAVYWYYKQFASAAKFTTSPNLWCSVTVDVRDISISPTDTPIVLVSPTAADTPDNEQSFNLTYPLTAHNLGLLPTNYLGQTTVTQTVSLPSDPTLSLYYANGVYLRGSANTHGIDYSLDGANWTATNLTTKNVTSFIWNGSVYVATTNLGIYYSVNGITWTISGQSTGSFINVTYANTKFVASSTAGLFYSSDGITWAACTGTGVGTGNFVKAVYGTGSAGGKWVAVTTDADAYGSSDGIAFTALTVSTSGFKSAAFADGIFQLGGAGDGIKYSTDGTTFIASNLTTLNINAIEFNSAINTWFAGTSVGIYSSINGLTWTIDTGASTGIFNGFAFNASELVAISTVGIYRSLASSISWSLASGAGETGSYDTVLYNNNIFLAGSTNQSLALSSDGITWSSGNTSVSGIFNGYTLTNTSCIINVVNVRGGNFNTTNTITIVLDSSQNGGVLTNGEEINCYAMVKNCPDVETLTTTYSDFYNLIGSLQSPTTSESNRFNVQGYYGYSASSVNAIPIANLTAPNVTYFKASARLDIPTLYQYPNIPAVHVMSTLFQDMNNQTPYNDVSGKFSILNIEASTNKGTWPSQDTLNQLATQGWSAIAPLTSGLMYNYRNFCTLQTNGGIPDNEYRSESLQQKVRWLDKNLVNVAEATVILPNGMRANNNPELIATMIANLNNVLLVGFNAGMLGNTNNNVTVTINPSDVGRLLINVNTTVVPTNAGNDITVYFQSYANSFSI